MNMNSVEFIQAVWTELEATGPTDFARKLGLGPDGLQKVSRWRKGGRLDYEDVMLMLRRTGWYQPHIDGDGATLATTRPPTPDRGDVLVPLLESIAAQIAQNQKEGLDNQRMALEGQQMLLEAQRELSDGLRALHEALGIPAAPGRTAPKQTRRRKVQ